jgi:phosphoglycerate-specific signal transduction histidine kinase
VYLSAAEKVGRIEHYQKLRQELAKTRELIDLLSSADSATKTNMTASFQELFSLLK